MLFDCYYKIYQATVERDVSQGKDRQDRHQHIFDAIVSLLEQWDNRTPGEIVAIRYVI